MKDVVICFQISIFASLGTVALFVALHKGAL